MANCLFKCYICFELAPILPPHPHPKKSYPTFLKFFLNLTSLKKLSFRNPIQDFKNYFLNFLKNLDSFNFLENLLWNFGNAVLKKGLLPPKNDYANRQ